MASELLNWKSKELFINLKPSDIPPRNHPDRKLFTQWERSKCLQGVTVNGQFIPPTLYWSFNHWAMEKDFIDEYGIIVKRPGQPDLRDNEWIIHQHMWLAEQEKFDVLEGGCRQIGKSANTAAILGRDLCLIEGCQNILVVGSSTDRGIILGYLEFGMRHCTDFLRVPQIDRNKNGTLYRYGVVLPNNEAIVKSQLHVRNTEEGQNTEVSAGVSIYRAVLDEALHKESIVYTSTGIQQIQHVQPGDQIYGADGQLTTVLDKINVGHKQLYNITLADNRTIEACGNHLWTVYDTITKQYKTKSTHELIATLGWVKYDKRYNKTVFSSRWSIPNTAPVNYNEKQLLIDPYYLGLWLGDGCKNNTDICTTDNEIINYVINYANKLDLQVRHHDCNYIISTDGGKGSKLPNKLLNWFKVYNLYNNKHIPIDYQQSSIPQRLALLQGLMDSNGTINNGNNISFCNSDKLLFDQTVELARSLGISVFIKEKQPYYQNNDVKKSGKLTYIARFYTELPLFRLSRKLKKQSVSSHNKAIAYRQRVTIKSIIPSRIDQAYCLKVNNINHLFLTTNYIVTHNCGKYPYARAYETLKPALISEFGKRSSSLLTFTGGDVKKTKDVETNYKNPVAGGFLPCVNDNVITGLFIDATYRQDFKYTTTLSNYLGLTTPSELDEVNIRVSDKQKATKILDAEYALTLTDVTRIKSIAHRIYNPRKINDMFLSVDTSPFARFFEALQRQRDYLIENPSGFAVELFKAGDGSVQHRLTDNPIINHYPVKNFENLNAPFYIWDLPRHTDTYHLHIGGCDPYNTGQTETSSSLGAVYIMRRQYDDLSDPYQDTMVAMYVARPEKTNDFHQQVLLLMEFYNARILHEASTDQFLNFFDTRNLADRYLVKTWSLQQEINPDSKARNTYGLMPVPRNQKFIIESIQEYMDEALGNEDNPKMGLTRILDPVLIDEFLSFGPEYNTDRVWAFGHALAYNKYLNKYFKPEVDIQPQSNTTTTYSRQPYGFNRSLSRNPFNQ